MNPPRVAKTATAHASSSSTSLVYAPIHPPGTRYSWALAEPTCPSHGAAAEKRMVPPDARDWLEGYASEHYPEHPPRQKICFFSFGISLHLKHAAGQGPMGLPRVCHCLGNR